MWNNSELVIGCCGAYYWWCAVLYSAKVCLIVYLCRLVISQTAEYHQTIRSSAIYMVHVHWGLVSRSYIHVAGSLEYCHQRSSCAPTSPTYPLDDIYSTPNPNHNDLVTPSSTFVTDFVYVQQFWAGIWVLWWVLLAVGGCIQPQSVAYSSTKVANQVTAR